MSKKDVSDVVQVIIIALCCPFAILVPPFNELLNNKNDNIAL